MLLWWHLFVGLSVLSLIITGFLTLYERERRMSVLLRVFAYVRPYKWGVALVFGLGLVTTGVAMVRVLLVKGLLDLILQSNDPDVGEILWCSEPPKRHSFEDTFLDVLTQARGHICLNETWGYDIGGDPLGAHLSG